MSDNHVPDVAFQISIGRTPGSAYGGVAPGSSSEPYAHQSRGAWLAPAPRIEPQARACQRLEFAVLARALLDATWRDPGDRATHKRSYRGDLRQARRDRQEARDWFGDPRQRDHIEIVADNAGMEPQILWRIVETFIAGTADPKPLHEALNRIFE